MGTSGNLSILIEPTNCEFLITASGKDKGELTEEDFILVDGKGIACNAHTDTKPSAETLLHAAIYKNTEAKAIYHVHTTNVTLLSMQTKSDFIQFSNLEMLKGLGFKTHDVKINIPIVDNSQDMKYIADIVPNYIDENVPGLILRGHGIYAWGKTLEEAKRHVEIFEFLFEYRVKELSIM